MLQLPRQLPVGPCHRHPASHRSLGQNFMLDDGVLSSIVEAAGVQPGDLVLEIGPGEWWQQLVGGALCPHNGAAHRAGWTPVLHTHAWMSRLPCICYLLPATT